MRNFIGNCKTHIEQIIPVLAQSTTTSQSYMLDILQRLCKQICISSAYPIVVDLNYKYMGSTKISDTEYRADIQIYGTVTYKPYQGSCCQDPIESINAIIPIPIYSSGGVAPSNVTVVGTGSAIADPLEVKLCCSLTNYININDVITITPTFPAA